jgi:hypothetical protein
VILTVDHAGILWSALPLALVAGIHAATWGAYKDSPYEGYHPIRQLRTIVVAALIAVLGVGTGLVDPHTALPAIGVIYALERLATEWWKTILRVDDQSAYSIPMRLGFRGRPVDVDWIRHGCGVLVLAALIASGASVHAAQNVLDGLPWWLVAVTVGGLGGWMTAVGGAWKDAPVEGFSGWKFLRSPAVATAWALPLTLMTSSWVTLCLAAGGLAVFSIETYKTFWTGGRAPGKFADQPQRHPQIAGRHLMGLLHAGAWVMFAVIGLGDALRSLAPEVRSSDLAMIDVFSSSIWAGDPGTRTLLPGVAVSMVVSAGALLVAASVLRANGRFLVSGRRDHREVILKSMLRTQAAEATQPSVSISIRVAEACPRVFVSESTTGLDSERA